MDEMGKFMSFVFSVKNKIGNLYKMRLFTFQIYL